MVIDWYAERYRLRRLKEENPQWGPTRLAEKMKHSLSWVKKWLKRLAEADPDDNEVLKGKSRVPKNGREPIAPAVVKEILSIRDNPPGNLKRIPGPKTIKYYLDKNETLKEAGHTVPQSTSTIWRILNENNRIFRQPEREYTPLTRNEPLEELELDFKDVTTVKVEATEKRMHLVETLNIVDTGSSLLVDNQARTDFTAETVIDSLVNTLRRVGVPRVIRFDRDPRFIGSWSATDFPGPLMKLLLNLGIEVDVCPPKKPWKNPYVERLNRTYKYEGILIYQPQTLEEVIDMNRDFKYHYNYERPNQALTCQNQPPALAFPVLPSLPQLPQIIDPDHWLSWADGKLYQRRVNRDGTIQIGKERYYIKRILRKQIVTLKIDAPQQQIEVLLGEEVLKTMPIKGLYGSPMVFDRYLELIKAEALSDWRRYKQQARYYLRLVD